MSVTYSRLGSLSLKKETTENTAVTPDTFVPINDEDISANYPYVPATPISGDRMVNRRAIDGPIPASAGTINLNIEPKTFGHFLNGLVGGLTSGNYMVISSASAAFTVGETITGGTSAATAVVVADFNQEFLLVNTISGTFQVGETITGGSSSSTATLGS